MADCFIGAGRTCGLATLCDTADEDTMNIRAISRPEFDQLLPLNPFLENLMVEQVEWFSNNSGRLLGVIARGEAVADWNYVILKRNTQGDFRVRKAMGNFFSLRSARVDLLLSMAEIEKLDPANRVPMGSPTTSKPDKLTRINPDRRN